MRAREACACVPECPLRDKGTRLQAKHPRELCDSFIHSGARLCRQLGGRRRTEDADREDRAEDDVQRHERHVALAERRAPCTRTGLTPATPAPRAVVSRQRARCTPHGRCMLPARCTVSGCSADVAPSGGSTDRRRAINAGGRSRALANGKFRKGSGKFRSFCVGISTSLPQHTLATVVLGSADVGRRCG